jgi:SAM-dependent methyltransferase
MLASLSVVKRLKGVRGAAHLAKLIAQVAKGADRATLDWVAPPRGIRSSEWARYLWDQWGHTRGKGDKDPGFRVEPAIAHLKRLCPDLGAPARVLDLGPRNWKEVSLLRAAGLGEIEALDLFPHDPRIRRGDLHRMPFASDTFDLVFASHVLEHAWEPKRALAEVTRVLKSGGRLWVHLPRNFEPGVKDRINYDNAKAMVAFFPPSARVSIVWDETSDAWFRALFAVTK